jgi:hypothetical protein
MNKSEFQKLSGKEIILIICTIFLAAVILATIVHWVQSVILDHANVTITAGVVSGLLPGVVWYRFKETFSKEK